MTHKVIKKGKLAHFLESLIQDYTVFAPVKEDGLVVFEQISSAGEAWLDYSNSKIPPKAILFPQCQTIFNYSLDKEEVKLTEPTFEQRPTVIFGIRPCDARSFVLLDKVFAGEEYQDVYYLARRQNSIIISLGCNSPASTCFCTSLGGSPFSSEGSDLLLVDIGDEYVVEVVTDNGGALVEKYEGFAEASEDKLSMAKQVADAAEARFKFQVSTEGVTQKLGDMFEDPFWERVHEKCLGCGVCTFLCPTCHCFDFTDEAADSSGCRICLWDSCMFPSFTVHASGANPRPSGKERMRQRIMHKFKYFVDNFDAQACVGCGRCVRDCPVNLDIREVLSSIQHR